MSCEPLFTLFFHLIQEMESKKEIDICELIVAELVRMKEKKRNEQFFCNTIGFVHFICIVVFDQNNS